MAYQENFGKPETSCKRFIIKLKSMVFKVNEKRRDIRQVERLTN